MDRFSNFIRKIERITVVYAFIYALMISFVLNSTMRKREIVLPMAVYVLIMLLVWVGMCFLLESIYSATAKLGQKFSLRPASSFGTWLTSWKGVLLRFAIIWTACFVVFLNRYPGALHSDAVVQLTEAVEMSGYENFNPAINTFILTFFVQLGMRIKDIGFGVAMYEFFQFTLYSFAATYALTVLDRARVGVVMKILGTLFFIYPNNVGFASSMWKDTFFAVMLLLTLTYTAGIFLKKEPMTRRRKIVLMFLVLVTSLSRNSGWSALLAGGICMFIYYKNRKTPIMQSGGRTAGLYL